MAKRISNRRGEFALLMMIRTVGLITMASAFLAVMTAWNAYDLSAQPIGASIDAVLRTLNFS